MRKIIYIIIAALLLSIIFTGTGLADAELLPDQYSSGYLTATGTHFELYNIKYPGLTIDSSNPVNLTLKSVPEMVKLRFEPIDSAPVTHITLNGLTPMATYYKIEDDYHNMTVFTTDSSGRYTYIQDITRKHYVFILLGSGDMTIQNGPNIKFINNSATGGDCTSIGNWDPGTKTCTLTTDFSGTIQIDSDDIILDGDGHTLIGSNTGDGVFIRDNSGFTIKDLEIHDFAYGICCMDYYIGDSDHKNHITDNIISNNGEGICFSDWYDYSKTIINRNIISNNDDGIFLHFSSRNITIMDNNINNNRWGIVSFDMSMDNTIIDNTIYDNFIGIIFDQSCCENVTNNNIFNNSGTGVCLSMTGCHIIKYNIISNNQNGITLGEVVSGNDITGNIILNNDYGIYAHSGMNTHDNTINTNIISNNNFGIYIEDSDDTYSEVYNNYITGNTISNNNYGIYILEAYDNFFYYNDLFGNTIYNAYEDLGSGNNDWDNGSIGNRYSNYDEPCEGCIDTDNNGICDFAYVIPGGSGIDHYPMVHWIYEWTGEGSDGGSDVTTSELQDAIHHWLDNIPVRGHILSLEDIQMIIAMWLC